MRYGYFDNVNREYVIERPDIPVSWTNYLGVKDLCTVISHNAGGYTFYKSPQHRRLTRFRPNAVPMDRPGHYVYLRDDETGDYWTISWQPVGKSLDNAKHQCRHGLSYSRFICDYSDIHAEQTLFIPVNDDVELWDIKIKNNSSKVRNLSVFSYVEFSFNHVEIDNQNFQMSLYCSGSHYEDGIIEFDLFYDPGSFTYITCNLTPDSFDAVRDKFIGPYRTETNPIGVERGLLSRSTELGNNHCGALHKELKIEPGQEVRLHFLLGPGDRNTAKSMREKYKTSDKVDEAFQELKEYWNYKLEAFQCETPHQGMNTMLNTWNLYQAETNVVWSRFASFIEVGGRTGLGYRDTAQDVLSVSHTNPEKCRQRIIELLRGQVSQGYGLHLFDPAWFDPEKPHDEFKSPTVVPTPSEKEIIHGIEDACSDDALWLIHSILEYIAETGETEILNEVVSFADGGEATVYEHMRRVIEFSAEQVGSNGICKGLRADWNDCLNLGGGESAMVSFLHYWALQAMIEISQYLGKTEDTDRYIKMAENVRETCEKVLWDGEWYIRGITAKGKKIGTREDEEGKVHLESNTWAVVSGCASRERALSCMDAVDKYLYSKYGLHLNAPSYTSPDDDIGFVTRVYPGIKENGAIFSHPNPWAWIAECKLGRGDRAMKFYDALLPYNQNDIIEIREAEPYSYCQFIMGRDHKAHGRARHPWMTGSAGWAYYAATHYMLGVRVTLKGLVIDPCIPSEWDGFEVRRRWRGATYNITVKNPDRVSKGVKEIYLNGSLVDGPIPPQPEGSMNEIKVIMG